MQIVNLRKTGGARMKDVNTYTIACQENDLVGYKTLKSANEVDPEDFVHVILSKVAKNKKVVVKIHEAKSPFASNEIMAMTALKGYRNTVKYVCDFTCQDNVDRWQKNVVSPQTFCIANGVANFHFIVMEYIHNGDLGDFFKTQQDTNILKSFFVQSALVIIELGSIYKIAHGDLNSGNILVAKTNKSSLTYNLFGTRTKVATFGVIPIFLDFGRCSKYEKHTRNKYDILQDVLLLFGIFSAWMQEDLKSKVRDFVANQLKSNKRDLPKLIEAIDVIFA